MQNEGAMLICIPTPNLEPIKTFPTPRSSKQSNPEPIKKR